ncbi:exosome complex exonuclease RRP45 [Trichinella spiralis]|uniref:exosome complex exonuclease RRP45 n=1 Tax=Trichinella spiralis TaxID=6334 RepID=UPI0001EFBA56|nr:exosome complex exonuclease RRP45 [Trichinella spiralis]
MGNRYILTVTDCFTKWTEVFALPNMEATTIAKTLAENYYCSRKDTNDCPSVGHQLSTTSSEMKPALEYVVKFLIDMYASILRIESDVGSGQLLVDYSLP